MAGEDSLKGLFHFICFMECFVWEISAPGLKKKTGFRTTVARQEEDSEIETIEFEIPEIDDPDTETWEKSGRAGRGRFWCG